MLNIIKQVRRVFANLMRKEKRVDCFVIHFNRPSFLKAQLKILSSHPRLRIYVIDNASTIENRQKSQALSRKFRARFISLNSNNGHEVVWSLGISRSVSGKSPYIVTDCDVLPPAGVDYVAILEQGLSKYPHVMKVGLDLNVSRIPFNFLQRKKVIEHEYGYIYRQVIDDDFQEAPVDTTFALYRGGYHSYSVWGTTSNEWEECCHALRTVKPEYEADHLGWHIIPPYNEETLQYFELIKNSSTGHWRL